MTTGAASEDRPRRAAIWATVLRSGLNVGVLLALYFLLPFDADGVVTVLILVAGLLAFAALAAWQVLTILRSGYPVLRAVEALSLSIPLFLVLFAGTYFLMSEHVAGSFNVPLTRIDGFYFVITVFATVGFGDIVPTSQVARVVVTGQMIADLLVLGVLLRTVVSAVRLNRQRSAAADNATGGSATGGSAAAVSAGKPTASRAASDADPST